VRVGYDIAPLSLNWAGERRYAASLLRALRTTTGVEVEELTLWRREPAGMFQRVAYQAVAEAVYYPLLLGRRARRAGVQLVHHPRHLVPPEHGLPGPSVVTVHDVLPLSEPDHYSKLILWRYRVLARSAVRSAALVLTGSRYSAGEIERRLGVDPARIRVTPYGVEERFRPVAVDRERLAGLGVRGPSRMTKEELPDASQADGRRGSRDDRHAAAGRANARSPRACGAARQPRTRAA
jgi:hypothetical protein